MKIFQYIFYIAWTLWSAYGILTNYTHYRIQEWIIIIAIVSPPYIILWHSIHKKRRQKKREGLQTSQNKTTSANPTDNIHSNPMF